MNQHNGKSLGYLFLLIFCIISLVFIVAISIIDHSFLSGYKEQILPNTTYYSSDWLNFFGSIGGGIFGAVIAILGVYWTIMSNQKTTEDLITSNMKLNEDANRKSILPILILNKIEGYYEGHLFGSLIARSLNAQRESDEVKPKNKDLIPLEDDMKYQEEIIDTIYFIIKQDEISISKKLNQEQDERIRDIFYLEKSGSSVYIQKNKFSYIACFVANGGNGAAINTIFNLYRENECEKGRKSIPINILKGNDFKLGFYSEGIYGNYILEINYYDIFNNEYSQEHKINFSEEECTIVTEINQRLIKITKP